MSNKEIYLKFYIDSDRDTSKIEEFVKKENITLEKFNNIVNNYLEELKKDTDKNKKISKLYLEYNLKFGKAKNKLSRRKEIERMINVISNYLNEDKHNIKEYLGKFDISYSDFKKFINNSKAYYLKDLEKNILKMFLKRENDFNKDMLEKVKLIVDKISDDLVNDKPFDIYNYYIELGWESSLLLYFLNNNKDVFSDFVIDNVRLYLKKYDIKEKKVILNDFINEIKDKNTAIGSKVIDKAILFMNEHNMPYDYKLFDIVLKNNKFSE